MSNTYRFDKAVHYLEQDREAHVPRPKCVLMLMYHAVPLSDLRSRYGMCCFVFGSRYCLAIPKSTMWITREHGQLGPRSRQGSSQHPPFAFLVPGRPIKKLSGLMSR